MSEFISFYKRLIMIGVWMMVVVQAYSNPEPSGADVMLWEGTLDDLADPETWVRTSLIPENHIEIKKLEEGDHTYSSFLGTGNGSTIMTLSRQIPAIQSGDGCHIIRVRYRASGKELPLIGSISSGPALMAPSVTKNFIVQADEAWHEAEISLELGRLASPALYIELGIGGEVSRDAQLDLASMQLLYRPEPVARAMLFSPNTGVLQKNDPDQTVSVKLHLADKTQQIPLKLSLGDPISDQLMQTLTETVGDGGLATFDFSKLDSGKYWITVESSEYGSLGEWTITKTETPPRNQVFIHQGIPLVNQEPFLLIGLYHASDPVLDIINKDNEKMGIPKITREQMMQSIEDRHFNVVHHSWIDGSDEYYQAAGAHGMMVVPETARRLETIEKSAKHPNLFGWYGMDEPRAGNIAEIKQLFDYYKALDPFHPVMTAICSGGLGFENVRFLDIALPDPYPVHFPDSPLTPTAVFIDNCREELLGNDPRTTVMHIPQLFTIDGNYHGHFQTYEQLRAETYLSIAKGARGIFYYAYFTHETLTPGMPNNPERKYWFLPESPLWDRIGELNLELERLKYFILSLKELDDIQLVEPGSVCLLARQTQNGRVVLLVNPLATPAQVKMRIPNSAGMEPYKCELPTQEAGDIWTASLPGYGVAIYWMPL